MTVTPSLALGLGAGLTCQNSLSFLACASGASFLLPGEQPVIEFACDVDFASFGEAHPAWKKTICLKGSVMKDDCDNCRLVNLHI